jgi:hypothetical protein
MALLPSLILALLLAASGSPIAPTLPPALIGIWTTAAASGNQYCDSSDCLSAYGGSETWTFTTDARWEYSQYLSSTLYECVQTTFLDVTGTATATDASLSLIAEHASNLQSDTCGESRYEELEITPSVYQWSIQSATDGHPQLYLTNDNGTSGPFDPRPAASDTGSPTP